MHLKILLFLAFGVLGGSTARILGFFATPSKSHLIIHMSVMKALVERGHEVTVITSLPLNYEHPNFTWIHIKDERLDEIHHVFSQKMISQPKNTWGNLRVMPLIIGSLFEFSNRSLNAPAVQELLRDPKAQFDLLFLGYFFNEFHLGLADHFKCPSIVIWMNQPIYPVMRLVGNPQEMSYVPAMFSTFKQPMGFFERLVNFASGTLEILLTSLFHYKTKSLYESNFPADRYRSFDEMVTNVSLVFAAHHFSQGPIRPVVPALIEIGGIQMKPTPDALSKELKDFLDNANEHGAIFFSFGTNVLVSELNSKVIEVIFNVFCSLKQSVVMKWEEDEIPVKAENIFFNKWLPQDDVLAHPNVRLFITHGGLGSIVESKDRGIPIVGIPIFGDQFANIERVRQEGWAIQVDFHTITEEKLGHAIKEILTNSTYTNQVKYHANLYSDRILGPKETAVFWSEYVLRHRGAPHLQSPVVHMSTFAHYSLDVLAFLGAVMYIVYKGTAFVFKRAFRCVLKKKVKTN